MNLEKKLKLLLAFVAILFILASVFTLNVKGNFTLSNKKVEILITRLDSLTCYNTFMQNIMKKTLKQKGYDLSFNQEDKKEELSYYSSLRALKDKKESIFFEQKLASVKSIVKTLNLDNLVVLTTNDKLDYENKVVLSTDLNLDPKNNYLLYDVDNLENYIFMFENKNVIIPSYSYDAFYFSNIKAIYTVDLCQILLNSLNEKDDKVDTIIYPTRKGVQSYFEPVKKVLLY